MSQLSTFPALTGDPVYFRTYSRFTQFGREQWSDTVKRMIDGLRKLGNLTEYQEALLRDYAMRLKAMPSGRWCWVGGSEWLEQPENFSGAYNCSNFCVTSFDRMAFMMSLSMMGVGTGTLLERQFTSQLPQITTKLNLEVIGEPGDLEREEATAIERTMTGTLISVGDSREGWCKAYELLLGLSATPELVQTNVSIQLGHIRPAGAKIRGFGGVTNPIGLVRMFTRVVEILNRNVGIQLSSVEICLILDEVALAVVAGNVRRCISCWERVSTILGIKKIQDVSVGERVLASDGRYHLVTDKFDQGVQATLKIKTQLSTISVTPNHRLAVMDALNHYIWVEAKDLILGDILISTPHTAGAETISTDEAWLLGTYIADGHTDLENCEKRNGGGGSSVFSMSTTSVETVGAKLIKCLSAKGYTPSTYSKGNSTKIAVYRKDLAEYLRQFKAPWGMPVIPETVWNGTMEIRASFLAGLWDGDGDDRAVLNSTKLEFLAEVQKLYLSLGIAVNLNVRKDKVVKGNTYEGCHNLTVVGQQSKLALKALVAPFLARIDYIPAAMNRSNLRLPKFFSNKWMDGKAGHNWDGFVADEMADGSLIPCPIVSIEPGETVQTYDIEVADVHEFIVNGLLSHNSANMRQFDANDTAAAAAKDNLWTVDANGVFGINPEKDAYRMGNHTLVFHQKPSLERCIQAVTKQYHSGEGAIMWAGESIARSNADVLDNPESKLEFLTRYEKDPTFAREYLSGIPIDMEDAAEKREYDHRMGRYGINPCFAAGTMVLTRDGHVPIEDLVGKTVKVWDGTNWRFVGNFRVTGENQRVFKVTLASGESIVATERHSFILENHSRQELRDLVVGNVLLKHLMVASGQVLEPKFDGWSEIVSIEFSHVADKVYCCTVTRSHSFALSCGVLVGNCGEITGRNFMCNLSEIHLNMLDPLDFDDQSGAFEAAALEVAILLHHEFIDEEQQYSRALDPIVGVSFTGLFDFFVQAFGIDWLRWWQAGRPGKFDLSADGFDKCQAVARLLGIEIKDPFVYRLYEGDIYRSLEAAYLNMWRERVEEVVGEYCQTNGLKIPNRCTTVQPSGTKSLLTGASPGWHPPKAAMFLRRMTFRRNDPVALACLELGYSIIPSQSDKDENNQLLDDPFDPRCTEWLVEIPIATSWADLEGVEDIDISKFSAIAQFDFYMGVQQHYVRHNTSATIELREDEIVPLSTKIYKAIQANDGYISAALLARFDTDFKAFPRLPFEPISKEKYHQLVAQVAERSTGKTFAQALAQFDAGEMTAEVGPSGCDSDKCLMAEVKPLGQLPVTDDINALFV